MSKYKKREWKPHVTYHGRMDFSTVPIDLARMAMLLDGEGTINVSYFEDRHQGISRYKFEVNVVNTNRLIIQWVLDNYFGCEYSVPESQPKNYKQRWIVYFPKMYAKVLLRSLLPYFVGKRRQVEIYVQMVDIVDCGLATINLYASLLDALYQEIRLLNKRGI